MDVLPFEDLPGAGCYGIDVLAERMVFRLALAAKLLTLQLSECGVKLTLSPRIWVTSLPVTVVEPEPRSVLSRATLSRNAPPAF